MRTRIALVVVGVVAMVAAVTPGADAETLRYGTIVGGGESHGSLTCQLVPDCLAWLASGCDPALTGHDPAWLTSIENVADLADGRTRRTFEYSHLVGFGGVQLQFWSKQCGVEIRSGRTHSFDNNRWWNDFGSPVRAPTGHPIYYPDARRLTILEIPSGAKWMTVVGNSSNKVEWKLTTRTSRR